MKLACVAVLVLAIGCKGSDDKKAAGTGSAAAPAAGGAGDCSKVATAVDAMTGNGPMAGAAAEVPGKLKEILVKRCTEDKWPQVAIDCYANDAKDMVGMKRCRDLLPPELGTKVLTEIRTVMAGAAGGMMPPGHGSSAAAGSAGAGSAAAGSGAPPVPPQAP